MRYANINSVHTHIGATFFIITPSFNFGRCSLVKILFCWVFVVLLVHIENHTICFIVLINAHVAKLFYLVTLDEELQKERDQKWSRTDGDAGSPLASLHFHGSNDRRKVLAQAYLSDESESNDRDEVPVVSEILENVVVLNSDLSAVDLIEQLKENEDIKDVGEVLFFLD